jgi:hypothetical protein
MNRVVNNINRMKLQIEQRIADGLTTAEAVEGTNKALDMEFDEYVRFQEIKSLAVADGTLSLDEGMTIYNYLGESGPEKFNKAPVAAKVVLTNLFAELLNRSIRRSA